jgi:hypothetical protein
MKIELIILELSKYFLFGCIIICLGSCSASKKIPQNELGNGRYVFKQSGRRPEKIQLQVNEDSLIIKSEEDHQAIVPEPDKDLTFLKTGQVWPASRDS